jgi:hypothetical protein
VGVCYLISLTRLLPRYVPAAVRQEGGFEKLPVPLVALAWSGRGAQFHNMAEADVHRIEFLHPYVLLPQVVERAEVGK